MPAANEQTATCLVKSDTAFLFIYLFIYLFIILFIYLHLYLMLVTQ